MSYLECKFEIEPYAPFCEILIANLSELGFDSFEEDSPFLKAYIEEGKDLDDLLKDLEYFDGKIKLISKSLLEKINWNEEWEKNFPPLSVLDFCHIRAPFHPKQDGFDFELIIEPKMSFGTGHHATTQGMILLMKDLEWPFKKVLDVGSGTGILAILAAKMGSDKLIATDIEDWAYENMLENFERNGVPQIKAIQGSLPLTEIEGQKFDLILANINKNVLLDQIPLYANLLRKDGVLLLSGFYRNDEEDISKACLTESLKKITETEKDNWMAIQYQLIKNS